MLKSDIPSFLYRLGVNVHARGVIRVRHTGPKLADYHKADKLTQEQRGQIVKAIPNAYFMGISPEYAPEQKNVAICIPVGPIPKVKA